jgi:hypothetical protein
MKNALVRPTAANRAAFEAERACAAAKLPTIELVGPASGFFTSSYNDQIVQGLRLARLWGKA